MCAFKVTNGSGNSVPESVKDNWYDNYEAKSEAKGPTLLRGLQVDFSLTFRSKVFSEGLLAVNESETLNRSFTIILAVH